MASKVNDLLNEQALANNEQFEPIRTVRPRYSYYDKGEDGAFARGERSTIRLLNPTSKSTKQPSSLDSYKSYKDLTENEDGYGRFFLQRVAVNYTEKSQILQTFGGSDVVYYFGSAPVVFDLAGLLFDDVHNGWFSEFAITYAEMLRGTKLAQHQQLVEIDTPSLKIVGTVSSFNHSQDSSRDTDIPFSIQVIAQRVFYKPFSVDGKVNLNPGEIAPTINGNNSDPSTLTQSAQNVLKRRTVEIDGLGTVEPYATGLVSSVTSISELLDAQASGINEFTDGLVDFLNSAVNPIEQLLGAVRDVTISATSLVRTVETSVQRIINVPMRVLANAEQTADMIKDSVGVVTYLPESLSDRISRFVKDGVYDGTEAILSGSKTSGETANILSKRPDRTGDGVGVLDGSSDAFATLSADEATLDQGASL